MAVVSRKEYIGVPRDAVENYKGKQLVFVTWDHHMLVAAPTMFRVDPNDNLGDLIKNQFQPLIQVDPDAASIDWGKVEWTKGTQPFTPDFDRSISENGIGHKQHLRMNTPGLRTLSPAE